MILRTALAYVTMAALAPMLSGVAATRAATQFCDIYPERCQYSGNGVYYYSPQGYRVVSAGTSSAGGTWGCAATDRSNHDHAVKMVKMQGGVFGAVSDSAAFIGAIA